MQYYIVKRKIDIYLKDNLKYFYVILKFRSLRLFISQQRMMMYYWWRKPLQFDITPSIPSRKIFGSHIPSMNGSFRPTLFDVISGKARRSYFHTNK